MGSERHRMCTCRRDDQAIGRITMEARWKRIGGNYNVDVEWQQSQHAWIGCAGNPLPKWHWELDAFSGMKHLSLPQADGRQV